MADPHNSLQRRLADLDENLFIPREISWLSFNARVLQEAADETVPVIERLRYLGISPTTWMNFSAFAWRRCAG